MQNTHQDTPNNDTDEGVFYAPWEKRAHRILSPFQEFIHGQTASGYVLMATAVVAIIIANSTLGEAYQHILHIPAGVHIGEWKMQLDLHHWINDALMALFFFLVGMELKREFLVGELADLRRAALPIVAAIGGMVVPALIYFAINPAGDAANGWGIPMATDIAFALGAMSLLGRRVPKALVTFLVALAIVDDLAAVLVIALFYTSQLSLHWLMTAAGLTAALVALNLAGIRKTLPYFIIAVLLWYAVFQSGVHATLAGVIGAFCVPARAKYAPAFFAERLTELTNELQESMKKDSNVMTNPRLQSVVQAIGYNVSGVRTPLQHLEHYWHIPVAFGVIPIFALFNAGVPLQFDSLSDVITNPIMLGVLLGLLLGKFVGISLACWLSIKLRLASLPEDVSFTQIAGAAMLAGIGFTMSIFIAELAFPTHPDYLLMAKIGILGASLLAGIIGFIWLWFAGKPKARP